MLTRRVVIVALLALGAWQGASAAWIHAKAVVAQVLIRSAWAGTALTGEAHRPWPWADMHPVSRLRVERLSVDLIALDGVSGEALAFGPGQLALGSGVTLLSAHRDTHFDFLGALQPGDRLSLEEQQGRSRQFRVEASRVVDHRNVAALADVPDGGLVLVTCWPLEERVPGGPERLLVMARPCAEDCDEPAYRVIR